MPRKKKEEVIATEIVEEVAIEEAKEEVKEEAKEEKAATTTAAKKSSKGAKAKKKTTKAKAATTKKKTAKAEANDKEVQEEKPVEKVVLKKKLWSPKDFSTTNINSAKKIFATNERKKAAKITPDAEATKRLLFSLDTRTATIFKGTITGISTIEVKGEKVYQFLVNSNCGVSGYIGRIIRINLEDYVLPLSTPIGDTLNPRTATEAEIRRFMDSRRGSTVRFAVTAIDKEDPANGFVLGSRKEAARIERNKWWYGVQMVEGKNNPVNILREDTVVESEILASTPFGVYCDIFGAEAFIPLKELDFVILRSAQDKYSVGSFIDLKLSDIVRKDGNVQFAASHKVLLYDMQAKYMNDYLPGDNVAGYVAQVRFDNLKNTIFAYVNVNDKFSMRCTIGRGVGRIPMAGDRVACTIKGKDVDVVEQKGQIWGVITHLYLD